MHAAHDCWGSYKYRCPSGTFRGDYGRTTWRIRANARRTRRARSTWGLRAFCVDCRIIAEIGGTKCLFRMFADTVSISSLPPARKNMADPLEAACALVGRFQYHFGRVEQKIDQAVIKLLDLDEKAGPIVTGSVDFAKKVNFVRTSAYEQAGNENDKQFAEKTCTDVFDINNVRQIAIHSSFEPAQDGSVQFRRTVARDGRIRLMP